MSTQNGEPSPDIREAALLAYMDEWDGNMRNMPRQDDIYRRGWADATAVVSDALENAQTTIREDKRVMDRDVHSAALVSAEREADRLALAAAREEVERLRAGIKTTILTHWHGKGCNEHNMCVCWKSDLRALLVGGL